MQQMDIFSLEEGIKKQTVKKDSKRLFDNHLSSMEYNMLLELKSYHVGRKNIIGMEEFAEQYLISTRKLRDHIKRLRKYQDVRISSCNDGYWIPLESEQEKSDHMMISRAMSSMDTVIDIDNKYINILFKHLSDRLKTCDMTTQNQIVIQFNGWENETVNHYGDKYQKKGGE